MTLISVGLHCLKKKTHFKLSSFVTCRSQSVRTIPLLIPGYSKPSIYPACVFMWVYSIYSCSGGLVYLWVAIWVWLPIVMNVRIGFHSSEQLGDCLFPPVWIPDVILCPGTQRLSKPPLLRVRVHPRFLWNRWSSVWVQVCVCVCAQTLWFFHLYLNKLCSLFVRFSYFCHTDCNVIKLVILQHSVGQHSVIYWYKTSGQ